MKSPSDLRQLKKRVDLKSLSRNEARVEIAKDVIAALKAKIIRTGDHMSSTYVVIKNPAARKRGTKQNENGDIQVPIREALKDMQSCQVCARGAMFVACIARDPSATLEAAYDEFDGEFYWVNNGVQTPDMIALKEYFTADELYELEEEFEHRSSDLNESEASRTERLIAMMTRIVKSEGFSI